jgi:thiol:disulfide interchange protein DsbA
MIKHLARLRLLALLGGLLLASACSAAPDTPAPFTEGDQYVTLPAPHQRLSAEGKVEVVEVFSYGCIHCAHFAPTAEELRKSLPKGVVFKLLPAPFNDAWMPFARAYYAARQLGVADKCNDAMYDAVWKSGELSAMNQAGNGLKPHDALPSIEDAAKVYARCGADPKEFVAVANSFSINTQTRRADDLVKAYGVNSTPTIVVNGKYRFSPGDAGGYPQTIELVKWLVAKEAAGK